MTRAVRRLSLIVMAMFLVLMGSSTWVQFVQAPALNEDPRNVRTTYREYGRARGPIVVAGEPIAASEPVDSPFGYLRTYSDGPLYAPVTGYSSVVFGRSGIERQANEILSGTSASLWREQLAALVTGRQSEGGSVELTIDPAAQRAAYEALGDRAGAVVALDPRTGAVLAMVSTPSFDPNLLTGHNTAAVNENWADLNADPSRPMLNRAIAGDLYPPGSTFKLVTAAALLESGEYTAESDVPAPTTFPLPGSTAEIRNPGGGTCGSGETVTLAYALQESCNTPFASLAVELGAEALQSQAQAFGFGQDLSVPMPVTPSVFPGGIDPAQTAMSAIGQFSVRVTPLQMAMVTAAIAGDGVLMEPYTVQTERGPDLRVVREASPTVLAEPISAETAEQLTAMMVNAVANGTGVNAQIPGIAVAGKTGTAESGLTGEGSEANPHAWFTAFAPAEDPQIAIAVVLEHGGSLQSEYTGAQLAAPIARAVMQAVIEP